jgi:quercetin dioxygenase-like cupin family protein/DNA-binding XRE family transcriptional regulator
MKIGEKTRKWRKEQGLRIVDLASKASMSPSYISQMERELVFPSVVALQKIAKGLNLHVADFFDEGNEIRNGNAQNDSAKYGPQIVRKNSRKGLVYAGTNVTYQLLTPDLKRNIELLLISALPGSESGEDNFVHEGEECGVVLQGRMEYWIDGTTILLEEGDSVYFRSNLPHRWRNAGDKELIAIWAITPPSF